MSAPTIKILKLSNDLESNSRSTIRAAVYARYSCLGNSEYSADEQILRIRSQVARELIRSKRHPHANVLIDERWVVKDEAKTGRVTRDGYELIKSGVSSGSFDMLLMDDISRLTRDMGDTIDLYEILVFKRIEGYSIADQISTLEPHAKDLFVFKSYANEQQSKNTSKNTIRGLEVRVLGGFSTGNNPFGYYTVATKTTIVKGIEKPSHFAIKVQHEQAEIVRRVWLLYADGYGFRAIATILRDEKVPTPTRGRKPGQGWSQTTIRNLLDQQKYIGIWPYRQTKVIKDPERNRLAQQPREKGEWLVSERPELRIISPDLERRVVERRDRDRAEAKTKKNGFVRSGSTPKHLLVGVAKCAACGGNFITTSGKGYMGCFNAHRRTSIPCENKQTVNMVRLETVLIGEVQKHLDDPSTFQYLAQRFNEIMMTKHGSVPGRLREVEEGIAEMTGAVANYDRFIRSGNWSDAISRSLAEAEERLKCLKSERGYLAGQVESRVYITPAAIRQQIASLPDLLADRTLAANHLLKRLFNGKVAMVPQQAGKSRYYEASGELNLHSMLQFNKRVGGVPEGHYVALEFISFKCIV